MVSAGYTTTTTIATMTEATAPISVATAVEPTTTLRETTIMALIFGWLRRMVGDGWISRIFVFQVGGYAYITVWLAAKGL